MCPGIWAENIDPFRRTDNSLFVIECTRAEETTALLDCFVKFRDMWRASKPSDAEAQKRRKIC